MNRLIYIFYFSFLSIVGWSQEAGDILIIAHMDAIKSDYDGYFEKTQSAVEGHYFISGSFTGSIGAEYWTRQGLSGVIGMRWYPRRNTFVRLRGLVGDVNDINIGGGFAKPMTEKLRFESVADYYFFGTFSIRVGFAYLLMKDNNTVPNLK